METNQGIQEAAVQRIGLNFIADIPLYKTEKPYKLFHYDILPDGQPMTNMQLEFHDDVLVEDVRGREENFTIDANSFAWINYPTKVPPEMQGSNEGIERYCKEIVELLETVFEPELVVLYDYRVSRFRSFCEEY